MHEPDPRTGDDRRRMERRRTTRNNLLAQSIPFRDPDACPGCGPKHISRVVNTIPHNGFIERRHRCTHCGETWPSYQTILHPLRLVQLVKAKLRRTPQGVVEGVTE